MTLDWVMAMGGSGTLTEKLFKSVKSKLKQKFPTDRYLIILG
jgi:hypothetical protein